MTPERCRKSFRLLPLFLVLLFAWPAAAQETTVPWHLGEAMGAEVCASVPFTRRVAANARRTWQPGLALVGGLLGSALVGGIGLTHTVVAGNPAALLWIPALMPLTALGVHLFSDAGFGWELLGSYIGAVATYPVGLIPFVLCYGASIEGTTGPTTPLLVAGATIMVLGPAVGAWLAALIDHRNRARLAVLPTVFGSPRTVVPGMRIVIRW